MNALDIADPIIEKTLSLLPPRFSSREAFVMLRAIGLQESKFKTRQQVSGPARSFWQFESGGGIRGVLSHHSTYRESRALCAVEGVTATAASVYDAMLQNDVIGCGFARLLLFTDPEPLPAVGDASGAWDYYLRLWRPGTPHPEAWAKNYALAISR